MTQTNIDALIEDNDALQLRCSFAEADLQEIARQCTDAGIPLLDKSGAKVRLVERVAALVRQKRAADQQAQWVRDEAAEKQGKLDRLGKAWTHGEELRAVRDRLDAQKAAAPECAA